MKAWVSAVFAAAVLTVTPAAASVTRTAPVATAASETRAAAEAGDVAAMLEMASKARKAGNEEAMFAWARKAAATGDANSQYYLGAILRGEPDCSESRVWVMRAAEQGLEKAVGAMGYYLDEGICGPRDYAQAAVWYERAARLGLAVAQNNLGWLYMKGKGVTRDYGIAYAWFVIASVQPDTDEPYAKWSPRDSRGFALDMARKLNDADFARAWALAGDLCRQDKVCIHVPEEPLAWLLGPVPSRK